MSHTSWDCLRHAVASRAGDCTLVRSGTRPRPSTAVKPGWKGGLREPAENVSEVDSSGRRLGALGGSTRC